MRWTLRLLVVALLLGITPLAAQESRPTPRDRYRALESKYRKDMDAHMKILKAMFEKVKAANEEIDFEKLPKGPAPNYIPEFEKLAAELAGTDAGLDCLLWLFENAAGDVIVLGGAPDSRPESLAPDMKAAKAIMEQYATSPKLAGFAMGLQFRVQPTPSGKLAKSLLERLSKDSPHREVRASALAAMLLPAYEAEDKATAEPLLALMKKDYADTQAYREHVAGILFEREFLAVGKVAPDFELTDLDGKSFKLSEYRGKVVYLDFWGFW